MARRTSDNSIRLSGVPIPPYDNSKQNKNKLRPHNIVGSIAIDKKLFALHPELASKSDSVKIRVRELITCFLFGLSGNQVIDELLSILSQAFINFLDDLKIIIHDQSIKRVNEIDELVENFFRTLTTGMVILTD